MDPLDALRPLMAAYSPPLHALLVPSEDAHQSEYVAAHDRRRAYVSGFTGSAGLAAITMNEALLWTDGRYFLQATEQLSSRWKLMRIGEDPVVEAWLAENLEKGANVGVDPWLISVETAQKWEQAFAKKGQKLIQLNRNLVDEIWKDRPQPEILPISAHPFNFAGQPCEEKISQIRSKLSQEKACAIILTALDEIAWLFNVRGKDVQYNPVVHSYAIVMPDSAFFYVDQRKITSEVESYLKEAGIEVRDYSNILSDVERLASGSLYLSTSSDCSPTNGVHEKEQPVTEHKNGGIGDCGLSSEGTLESEINQQVSEVVGQVTTNNLHKEKCGLIWLDPGSCCYALYSKLHPDQLLLRQSPIAFSKALKNPVELDGLRNAHIRDGAALVSYFAWLDHQMQEVYGAAGYFSDSKGTNKRKRSEADKLTEVSVSNKLEEFRAKQEHFMGLSFETISSVGSNAAIIHYSPQPDTCAELQAESIYLCDSGGQYLDGTTDVTRTVHFGKPSAHEKTCYTLVLKGHIALDAAVFPNGTTGHALDILARVPLWQLGLDYRHGTGHGVGSYLNVHEGPHLISFRPHARNVAIQASMTVTDEPGYYEDGNFGIRLENVLIVTEAQTSFNFANKGYLSFEHITWMPYQKKLIDISLLSPSDKEWIDNYHTNCREKLTPFLNGSDLEWLIKATEPLSASDSI